MARKYDIVIFDATGFTGKYCVENVVKLQQEKSPEHLYNTFTWAVAGSSMQRLDQVLKEVTDFTGVNATQVDKIVADLSSVESLREMAKQCSVVVNCVGPYRLYGEKVIQACLLEETNHVDVAAEQLFLEGTQLNHHKEAEEKGIYIIGACGFDSILADCGVTYLQQKFDGDVNSVDCYLVPESKDKTTKILYGTYHSAIHQLANMNEVRNLHKTLLSKELPQLKKYSIFSWLPLKYSRESKNWAGFFPGPDLAVVQRSQYYFYTQENRRPIQFYPYFKPPGILNTFLFLVCYLVALVLAQFCWGLRLLEIIQGKNPGYGATPTIVIESALTIAFEKESLPSTGGVLTPGVAFENTTLIKRLNSRGISFQIKE